MLDNGIENGLEQVGVGFFDRMLIRTDAQTIFHESTNGRLG